MANNLSKTERRLQKETCEKYQNLCEKQEHKRLKKTEERYQKLKKIKKKNISIIGNVIKIFLRNKNRS